MNGYKIINFQISQKEKRVTVVLDKGKFSLEQFGFDVVCVSPVPYLKKSHHLYLSLKKVIALSDYFSRQNRIASEIQIKSIRQALKCFEGVTLKTI